MSPTADVETRTLQLRLTVFGWRLLGEQAASEGITVERVLADACEHFVGMPDGGSPSRWPPRFKQGDVAAHEFAVPLAPSTWTWLEDEAHRSGVRLEALVEHAHIVYQEYLDRAAEPDGPQQQS